MKLIGIILLMMISMTIFSIIIDIYLLGFGLRYAIIDWFRPFFVTTFTEKIIFSLYPLSIIVQPIVFYYQKRKQNVKNGR
ncbi:hypothetical protein JOC94_002492 [Bacillus thermophilus]|uniref:Uncharacterized protein n=1 Tax=Siminovitchia thermophila TaxID=1245522 RepID=A0ABS2R8J6_9BACI|nr:hypothetical protein [Siminovitchia thermophila]MBM7715504.1 hypothetical protein [Siminovitchia thermophila]ONK21406.1 hypothetical protein BLX87_21275 [Bacillus sp. VT-16-64]